MLSLLSVGLGCEVDPFGDFNVGRWLWFLDDIEKLPEPIPAKGRQGLWNWSDR